MTSVSARKLAGVLVVLTAGIVGIVALARHDVTGRRRGKLPGAFTYDTRSMRKVDPATVRYRQSGEIRLTMKSPRALAVGPDDRVYVAGDKSIQVFAPQVEASSAKPLCEIALTDAPLCLALSPRREAEETSAGQTSRIYVGLRDRVEVYGLEGKRLAQWESLGPKAVITSVAAGENDVFLADAGNLIVLRYSPEGKLLGRIGQRDPQRDQRGFAVPSPYFDLAIAPDGLLRVVNPAYHRIEAYTPDGDREMVWGAPGDQLENFCGCCNPAHIAIFPDGRVVTAEKGIPRVKVYRPDGTLLGLVAGPDVLVPSDAKLGETRQEHRQPVVEVAADHRGRVLVLDPGTGKVRIFESKDNADEHL